MLTKDEIIELEQLAYNNRRNVLDMVYGANSGHIGGSLSAADFMTVLFHKCMNNFNNGGDRFVLSKGHISPLYYSILSQLGIIEESELKTFRQLGSRLQGHPCLLCPGVQFATGSLGQGLSMACGCAMALKLDNNPSKVYVVMGDGELQEGSVWEAFMQASHRKLSNIIAIIDKNGLQIDGSTDDVMSLGNLSDKIKAFGWQVFEVDGHNLDAIFDTIQSAKNVSDKPVAIIANTIKGKGVDFMENNPGWHGKAPSEQDYKKAIEILK